MAHSGRALGGWRFAGVIAFAAAGGSAGPAGDTCAQGAGGEFCPWNCAGFEGEVDTVDLLALLSQ